MEDKKLLRLLHKDPNAGMEQLMDQYAGLVYSIVKDRLTDSCYISSDIEDCVADVFSSFYLALHDYDPKRCSIRAYLCVIARNRSIDTAKRRSHQQRNVSLDDHDSFLQIADDIEVEGKCDESELRQKVIKAIKELGEPDSEIIFRKFYYGQASKVIAERMGLSVSNIDTRTHRALQKLRNVLGEQDV